MKRRKKKFFRRFMKLFRRFIKGESAFRFCKEEKERSLSDYELGSKVA